MTAVSTDDSIGVVDVNGIRTRYYDDRGAGDPIVLIHGAHFGFVAPIGIEQWALSLEPLGAHGRVIAFDRLGQGHTDAPPADEDWTFASVAEHAIGFLDALDVRDVTLVGHSRGGLLALHIAIARPDLVRRLVVVSSASAAPDLDVPIVNEAAQTVAGGIPIAEIVPMLHLAQATDRPVPPAFAAFAEEVAALPKYRAEGETLRRVESRYWTPSLTIARQRVLDHLRDRGLDIPTLVIWGMNDRSAPIALGHALFELIAARTPHSTMLTVNQAGHNLFIDQAEIFTAAVAAFATDGRTLT